MIKFTAGDCEAAIEQYKKAFGCDIPVFLRFSDAKEYEGKLKNEEEYEFVYHAQMVLGKQRYLLCDNLFDDLPYGHSMYLVATFSRDDDVKKAFEVMSDGATIISPLAKNDISSCCGTLIDRFGVKWDLMTYVY
jgi:PhnB protein